MIQCNGRHYSSAPVRRASALIFLFAAMVFGICPAGGVPPPTQERVPRFSVSAPNATVELPSSAEAAAVTVSPWYIESSAKTSPYLRTLGVLRTFGVVLEAGVKEGEREGRMIDLVLSGQVKVTLDPARNVSELYRLEDLERRANAIIRDAAKGREKFWSKRLGTDSIPMETRRTVRLGPGETRTLALGEGYSPALLDALMKRQQKAARVFLDRLEATRKLVKELQLPRKKALLRGLFPFAE